MKNIFNLLKQKISKQFTFRNFFIRTISVSLFVPIIHFVIYPLLSAVLDSDNYEILFRLYMGLSAIVPMWLVKIFAELLVVDYLNFSVQAPDGADPSNITSSAIRHDNPTQGSSNPQANNNPPAINPVRDPNTPGHVTDPGYNGPIPGNPVPRNGFPRDRDPYIHTLYDLDWSIDRALQFPPYNEYGSNQPYAKNMANLLEYDRRVYNRSVINGHTFNSLNPSAQNFLRSYLVNKGLNSNNNINLRNSLRDIY